MKYCVITLFPQMLESLKVGITGRALDLGNIQLDSINPRDFTSDKHRTVDDTPYGGGPGMLMRPEPLHLATQHAKQALPNAKVIGLSPQGKRFDQAAAKQMAKETKEIIFIAGRYEGIDQRFIETNVDEEWSIGDYTISGGELAAMVMIDTIARLLPGVVGDKASVTQDTFYQGLLKHPQYTRPEVYQGKAVPKTLLSGNHKLIGRWRLKHSLGTTWLKRPDLLEKITLSKQEQQLLDEFIEEHK